MSVVRVIAQVAYAALLLLCGYALFIAPKIHYRHDLQLRAPSGSVSSIIEDARLVSSDRALTLSARRGGRGAPRVLVRDSLATADIYHRLAALPPAEQVRVELTLPQTLAAAPALQVQGDWSLDVDTRSDYGSQVLRRLWWVLPLALGPLLLWRLLGATCSRRWGPSRSNWWGRSTSARSGP